MLFAADTVMAVVSTVANAPGMRYLGEPRCIEAIGGLGRGWFFGLCEQAVIERIMALPEVSLLRCMRRARSGAPSDTMGRIWALLQSASLDASVSSLFSSKATACEPAQTVRVTVSDDFSGGVVEASMASTAVPAAAHASVGAGPQLSASELPSGPQLVALLQQLHREPLSKRVRARKSDIHGWGLFAKRRIRKGGEDGTKTAS